MITQSAYHGLTAPPQTLASIADFQLRIHPPRSLNGNSNLFALMYEALIGANWPFGDVRLCLREIMPFQMDIMNEVCTHLAITPALFPMQSLLRAEAAPHNSAWLEMLVPSEWSSVIVNILAHLSPEVIPVDKLSSSDAHSWLLGMHRTKSTMKSHVILRTHRVSWESNNSIPYPDLKAHSIADVASDDGTWWLASDIELSGIRGRWHPLLSDYLFAFCLSTILRYQPHLLKASTIDRFIAAAWCRQSPITVLRYFLMALTTPAILIRRSD